MTTIINFIQTAQYRIDFIIRFHDIRIFLLKPVYTIPIFTFYTRRNSVFPKIVDRRLIDSRSVGIVFEINKLGKCYFILTRVHLFQCRTIFGYFLTQFTPTDQIEFTDSFASEFKHPLIFYNLHQIRSIVDISIDFCSLQSIGKITSPHLFYISPGIGKVSFTANKVTDFNYLQMGYGYRDAALINILAGDELYAYFPFNPQVQLRGWYSQMMPRDSEEKVVTAFTDGSQLGGLITAGKKVLYSPGYRIYYPLKCAAGTENYQADFATYFEKKLYIWDNGQKKIFLFNTRDNTKLTGLTRVRMDMYNVAMLTELEPLLFTGERSLKDMTLVTALGNTWDDKNTYIDFIFRRSNNTYVRYSLYTNSVGGKELPKMEVSLLPYLVLDEGSRIIVSREYPNQYFVTRENSLYIYNLSTDESLGSVIRGMYDYENGDWNHRYIIRNLFSDRMTWIATDDAQNVSVYKRCPGVPQEILDAYKDEIEAEESEK